MSDDYEAYSKPGCFQRLVSLVISVLLIGLAYGVFLMSQPQNLDEIKKAAALADPASKREMKAVLQNAIDRGYPVPLTEAQINQWLKRAITGKQNGPLKIDATFKNVWVKLDDSVAEIIMERVVFGNTITTSMFLQVEKRETAEGVHTEVSFDGGPFHPQAPKPPRGGRFGSLVVPQGFLILTMPAYENLAKLLNDELDLGFREMASIKIEKGKLTLDPRPDSGPNARVPF